MDGLRVSADGGTYSTPADSSQDETSALEAWWRKIDAPEVQGAVPTEAILKGLMNIGHQGHPLPSSTLHWHLDTADRAPSRVRIDNAARKASRLAIAQADQRAANAIRRPRGNRVAVQLLPGALDMEARPQRQPTLPSQFFPTRDGVPSTDWKNVHRSCAGFPAPLRPRAGGGYTYSSLTTLFRAGWSEVKRCCADKSFPSPSRWVHDLLNLHQTEAELPTQVYPAALVACASLLLRCLSSIHSSTGRAVPHGTFIWVDSGPHLVLVGLSRHIRRARGAVNNAFATTPALSPSVPLSARRALEVDLPIRWQWWPPGQFDLPDRHVMSTSDAAVQVKIDSADHDGHALGVIGIADQGKMYNSRGSPAWIERLSLDRRSIATASLDLRPGRRLLLAWSNPVFQLCLNFLVFFDIIDDRMLCAWVPSDLHAGPSSQAEGGLVLTTDGETPFCLVGVNLGDTQMDASAYVPNTVGNPSLVWLSPFVNAANLIDTYLVNQ